MTSSAPFSEAEHRPSAAPAKPAIAAQADPQAAPEARTASPGPTSFPIPDVERLAANAARLVEEGGKALAAYLKPFEAGNKPSNDTAENVAAAVTAIGRVAEYWMRDPLRASEAQIAIAGPFLQLWAQTYRRMQGEPAAPVIPVAKGDKRFAAPEWQDNPFFDFLRQAHAIGAAWAEGLADRTDSLDPQTRAKAKFYLRQVTSALSPANFVATNPQLLRETVASSGDNLVRGATLFAEDIEAGAGQLRIRQTDEEKFVLGVNIATTPGKVVFRNDLVELIQYAPTTPNVLKRPLLIVPPWINKFYILDLNPAKSFVRWAVAEGVTVFMLSWVNPDERHREKGFEAYMHEGLFAALDAIEAATGEDAVSAVGYCVGGTLLSTALAYMAATGDRRIESTTLFAAQTDFTDAGEIQVFVDRDQVKALEADMSGPGYLEASKMAMAFNMLRPNDLIWSYVVDNYMRGKIPPAFDLLSWNADSTRLPARNHSFYLRNFYMHNRLAKGELTIDGVRLSLAAVTVPIYSLATQDDHIAPAASVYCGAQLFGGPVRFVLGGSGHIAGVVNPPARGKYHYATGPRPFGVLADWLTQSSQQPGSWWPDWLTWLTVQAPARVPARVPGDGGLPVIGDAPGEYVQVRSQGRAGVTAPA